MYSVFKNINKNLSIIKKIKPKTKPKKHIFDIENESWVKPKKPKPFSYFYLKYIIDMSEKIEKKY